MFVAPKKVTSVEDKKTQSVMSMCCIQNVLTVAEKTTLEANQWQKSTFMIDFVVLLSTYSSYVDQMLFLRSPTNGFPITAFVRCAAAWFGRSFGVIRKGFPIP